MVEEEAPAQVATPAKAAKKRVVKPKNSTVPSVRELIVQAVTASKDRKGVSVHALKKALIVGGYDVDSNRGRVRLTIRKLVDAGVLEQLKGIGASGSFKMSKKAAEPKTKKIVKKSPAKVKKPVAKKPPAAAKKPKAKVVKKPAATKAAAVKKSPKKVKKSPAKKMSKSPRKVQKSPKKVEKKPKSPAAKKPAKKAAKPKAKKVAAKKK